MRSPQFPLFLSPNLGCPHILDVNKIPISIPLIVAGQYGSRTRPTKEAFRDHFRLVPSYQGEGHEVGLVVSDDPAEIVDWNQLSEFANLEDTQMLINSELHYKVLGEGTRYWRINVDLEPADLVGLLREREVNGKSRTLPTLYDLVMVGEPRETERFNYHAVQFVPEIRAGNCTFLHLTDAHVARRNDEILDEVLKFENDKSEKEIRSNYINFNRHFRDAIGAANDLANRGELDFVLLLGGLG